jgi:hypothetical protein
MHQKQPPAKTALCQRALADLSLEIGGHDIRLRVFRTGRGRRGAARRAGRQGQKRTKGESGEAHGGQASGSKTSDTELMQ